MLNLYANETRGGIMSLVTNKAKLSAANDVNNRRIITTFSVVGLLVLSVIANGSQAQARFEQQQQSEIASYTSVL